MTRTNLKVPEPESVDQFLDLLNVPDDADTEDVRAAILVWASKQPATFGKIPAGWIDSLTQIDSWPSEKEIAAALRTGDAIRSFGFMRIPKALLVSNT